MTNSLKIAGWSAVLLSALWWLAPQKTREIDDDAIVIRYMAPEGPIRDAMEDAVREFEFLANERHRLDPSQPRYRVVAGQHASRDQVEDPTRFLLSLAGGDPPDVIFFDRFAISEWASRGAFVPLDSFMEKDQIKWSEWELGGRPNDPLALPWPGALAEEPRATGAWPLADIKPIYSGDFFPGAWDEIVYRNPLTGEAHPYGIPNNADNRVLLYNKDMLVRYGFVDENGEARPPQTWEELEEMALTMTERDAAGNLQRVGFIPNYGNTFLYMYGWMAGGEFMSDDGLTVTLNDPNILYALDYVTSLYDQLGGAREVDSFQSTFQRDALDPFIMGKVAMKIDGVWVMSSLARYGRDLNVGAAPPPLPKAELEKGRHPISWIGGWAYAIPSTAQEKDAAWELIRFLSSRRALEIMARSEHYTYLAQGRPFVPRQVANREFNEWLYQEFIAGNPALEQKFKDVMAVFNDMLEYSRCRPVTPVGQKLWNAQRWAMDDAINHERTPEGALAYYNSSVQRDLNMVLFPPEGRPITRWGWFFWLYGIILILVVIWIYRRDSGMSHRKTSGFSLGAFFTGEKNVHSVIEGSKGSYFRSQWKEGVICALPWIIGFIVFTGGPMLFSIVISFCRYDILNPAVFTGLDNYWFMFTRDDLFWKSLGNTVFMVIGIPLGMAVGLGMAILLTQKVRGVAVWRTLFYLPSIVPMVAASILWIWIFNPQSGLLNGLLELIGITGPKWLQDKNTSKWALILMGLWTAGGGMIIWIAGLKGISDSYYEAASIDGANKWQQFKYITIPMLTPYIFFNLIMGLIGTFQIFTQAFIMTAGGPVNSTLFYAYYLFNNAFRYLNMGYAAAMAWFLFVIVLILTAFQMRLSRRWVHYEDEG
ncbi:MAG TPA: extracellular solute-binding protein [Kiritimatiellia bacterium]|nr:extracellular solute-binding protein [Kiritimatiellia bacterium]